MPAPNVCFNPLRKNKHKSAKKNLKLVNANWSSVYSPFIGKYLCDSCRLAILSSSLPPSCVKIPTAEAVKDELHLSDSYSDTEPDGFSSDYEISDNECKKRKIDNDLNESSDLSNGESSTLAAWTEQVKVAISNATSKAEKIKILTTLPEDYGVRKIHRIFGVSRRAAWNAKMLQKSRGYASTPDKKKGRALSVDVLAAVENCYTSDNASRIMAGKRQYVTVMKNDGESEDKQKRLLLHNIKDLHDKFCKEHPDIKISLSAFTKLRPVWCIPVGKNGTHNVCVCVIHQNMNLKFAGVNDSLKKSGVVSQFEVGRSLQKMVCQNPTANCFLFECDGCPGIAPVFEDFKNLFDAHKIEKIDYKSWTSTDRCELQCFSKTPVEFLDELQKGLPSLLKHDYIAKAQAEYIDNIKINLQSGEFIVTLDFSENFSIVVQDAVQSFHWSNGQVTIHPYVVYYKDDDKLLRHNFVIISESRKHDAVAVNLFNKKMLSYLFNVHGKKNVKKLIFFSDGAASQYKNKYNFLNCVHLMKKHKIEIEWNFHATAHGKCACDGVGASVKRNAHRASLQRPLNDQILTAKNLYDWAINAFQKVSFDFCTEKEHEKEHKALEPRFTKATSIKKTRDYHSFVPLMNDVKHILCKKISSRNISDKRQIQK